MSARQALYSPMTYSCKLAHDGGDEDVGKDSSDLPMNSMSVLRHPSGGW